MSLANLPSRAPDRPTPAPAPSAAPRRDSPTAPRSPSAATSTPPVKASTPPAPRPTAPAALSAPSAPSAAQPTSATEHAEERSGRSDRVNQLRAGVLGANDGIVSVAGLAVGVAGATTDITWLLVAGLASLIAGALSMAMGEYVSVSTQRDTDRALIERTRHELAEDPTAQHGALVRSLVETGIPQDVVEEVADSLESHDALTAHTRFRHGVEQDAVVSPVSAAVASLLSFTLGGIIPLLAILAAAPAWRLPATLVAVVVALALLGVVSARLGQADARTATVRTIIGGVLALLVTYGIGAVLGGVIG